MYLTITTFWKRNQVYIYLFLATFVILVLKFPDIWLGGEVLAGWDTVGHYQAFLRQIELIRGGSLKGYMLDWFGGLPFFYFYSPLFFWLGGFLAALAPFLSPVLIFKALIIFSLASLPPIFYFFSKTFLPLKPSPWLAGLLAWLYIFYQPVAFGDLGIGLAGAVASGLVTHGIGLALSLIFLSYLKILLDSEANFWRERSFYLSIISGSAILYAHLLSTVFAAVLGVIILLFYWRQKQAYLKAILVFLGIAMLSAYFLLPFLSFADYSSGWSYRRSEGFFFDPLQPLLALDPLDFIHGRWSSINWSWLAIALSFIFGFCILAGKRLFLLPAMFLLPFLVVPRNYLSQVLGFSLHYYRIMPLLIIFFLAIALYGLTVLDDRLKSVKKFQWRRSFMWLIIFSLVFWRLAIFSFSLSRQNVNPNIAISTNSPIEYIPDMSGYKGFGAANQVLDCLQAQGGLEGRVSVEHELRLLTKQSGSAHFFDYALPKIGVPMLQGLYSESANQTAFIYPSFSKISPRAEGYEYPESYYLSKNDFYRQQTILDSIKQKGLFNVQYIISYTSEANDNLIIQPSAYIKPVYCENTHFGLYEINKSWRRPYVSRPAYQPALFVAGHGDHITFRFLSLGWFSLTDLRDAPIIYRPDIGVGEWEKVNASDRQNISALIVGSEYLSEAEIRSLISTGKDILIISRGFYQGSKLPKEFSLIQNFLPTAGFDEYNQPYQPNVSSLEKFRDFMTQSVMTSEYENSDADFPELAEWGGKRISFTGRGPVIINASFFPAWRPQGGETLFEVTPGQMLVFSDGKTNLDFRPTSADKVGGLLTAISLIAVLAALKWHKKLF